MGLERRKVCVLEPAAVARSVGGLVGVLPDVVLVRHRLRRRLGDRMRAGRLPGRRLRARERRRRRARPATGARPAAPRPSARRLGLHLDLGFQLLHHLVDGRNRKVLEVLIRGGFRCDGVNNRRDHHGGEIVEHRHRLGRRWPGSDLRRQLAIGLRSPGARVVDRDRLPEPRRLGQADGPGDDHVIHEVAEEPLDLFDDLARQLGPWIEHGHDDPRQPQVRIDVLLDQAHVPQELPQPLERVVLALDRNDELLRGGERVDRQQAERRRAVEEDEVIPTFPDRIQGLLEPGLSGELADQLDLRARQIDRRRDRMESFDRGVDDGVVDGGLRHDHVVDGGLPGLVPDAHPG